MRPHVRTVITLSVALALSPAAPAGEPAALGKEVAALRQALQEHAALLRSTQAALRQLATKAPQPVPAGQADPGRQLAAERDARAEAEAALAAARQEVVKARAEADQLKTRLLQADAERAVLAQRADLLLRRTQELEAALARTLSGGAAPVPPAPEGTKPAIIRGKVGKVNGAMLELSIGADAGLQKGDTLEVYRAKPEPRYLGSVIVLEVTPRSAVARVPLAPANAATGIRAGDDVTNSLRPGQE